MLDTPEAAPTSRCGTEAVAAADAHPLDMPIPTATTTSGSTNGPYAHESVTKLSTAKPPVATADPIATTAREPIRPARPLTNGATSTMPAAAGSVANPACNGENPSPAG